MLKRAVPCALLALLPAWPAAAQELTLDEVLSNHYEAIGGLDAWQGVQTMKATGRMMIMPGTEAAFAMTRKRPNKVRLEYTFQGMTGIMAYDGETGWTVMPFMGKTEPEPVPDEDVKDLEDMADMDGVLVGYEESGHQVEYLGLEETEGTPAYKLKVTLNSGDVQYIYLDSEYFLPIKAEGTREVRGTVVEYESILSDYKEVGGVMIPHSMDQRPKGAPSGQTIMLDHVELNVEVDDAIFTMPETTEVGQQQ
jgi:outer membrane lipoprotein-sorting protein